MIRRNLDLTGTLHSRKLKAFGENFLENTLKPFYKSDPIPETNDMNVKVVAGNNFDEIVLNESKDVLLEPYQLWNYGEYKFKSLETSEDPIGLQRSSELLLHVLLIRRRLSTCLETCSLSNSISLLILRVIDKLTKSISSSICRVTDKLTSR